MPFLVRYLEIFTMFSLQAGCLHDIFSPRFHYISHFYHIYATNLHHEKFSGHLFTMFSPQIYTTKGQTDRDEQTPWGHTDRFSPRIFTTDFHRRFSPHLHNKFTPQEFFITSFHQVFTTNLHNKGMNRQGRTDSMGTHRHIFTTDFHTNLHHRSHSHESMIWG